jgi:hypothetical protein
MSIYQSSSGQWIFFDGATKHYFDTRMEALEMAQKIKFVEQAQGASTSLAATFNELADLISVYYDRGYNDIGGNPIVDGDITGTGNTTAQVAAFVTMAEELVKFANNQAVVVGDYSATVNAMRTDV